MEEIMMADVDLQGVGGKVAEGGGQFGEVGFRLQEGKLGLEPDIETRHRVESHVIVEIGKLPVEFGVFREPVEVGVDGDKIYAGMPAREIKEQHKKEAVLTEIVSIKKRLQKLENADNTS